jgi:predicted transcriptional regulator
MATGSKELLSIEKLEKAAGILKAIAHPVRMSIIELLNKNEAMNVSFITSPDRPEKHQSIKISPGR